MNKKKISSIVAGVAAFALLGGSLVYYNFIDEAPVSTVAVGAEAPNFIAKPFNVNGDKFTLSNDVYTLVGQRGKPCVINFWETWCSACIQELHEFNQIQVDYGDKIDVVAIAGVTSTPEQLETWLSTKGWSKLDEHNDWATFSLTFAYLPSADCKKMGCSGFLPRTVIVDKEGVVVHEQDGSMTYEALDEILKGLV